MPSRVHFGLGDATRIDRLTIPGRRATVQTIDDLAADRHIVIEGGTAGR